MSTPTNYPAFSPYLSVNNAAQAIEFYKAAFGATERLRLTDKASGKIGHAEILIGGNLVMLNDENPQWGNKSPLTLSGSPITFCLMVDNADAALERAVSVGATVLMPASDQFYGFRSASIADPFGHQWMLQHEIEKVSPEELQKRWSTMSGGCTGA
ncbi:VOC family protein [Rariglobus hedericola]|uniref:VOC family protein n=1 Tax=Rariglobus hedericola TaxID=2597822 RepID=A0A556QGR1_9BACT|nr:VOC family protein [Rariglobus hedericola]TSJ75824.1 VOC family protein [Rariglobus hedericola]